MKLRHGRLPITTEDDTRGPYVEDIKEVSVNVTVTEHYL